MGQFAHLEVWNAGDGDGEVGECVVDGLELVEARQKADGGGQALEEIGRDIKFDQLGEVGDLVRQLLQLTTRQVENLSGPTPIHRM